MIPIGMNPTVPRCYRPAAGRTGEPVIGGTASWDFGSVKKSKKHFRFRLEFEFEFESEFVLNHKVCMTRYIF